ncbi:MAG: hypothetical protein R3229_13825 [Alphaproteobacteria bacterium]|nr:hypothetical protein [Alphaproteobacteria bacterium]
MEVGRRSSDNPAMRTKMKGAIVKVLRKAKPEGGRIKRFPGGRRPGGYVRLAHTGIKKMFKGEPLMLEPRLNVARPAPNPDLNSDRARFVALALDTLAPALARTTVHGRPVTVTVPDSETALVFRAALDLTAVNRPTDSLIEIRVRDA